MAHKSTHAVNAAGREAPMDHMGMGVHTNESQICILAEGAS
jgi:hypothetical protein